MILPPWPAVASIVWASRVPDNDIFRIGVPGSLEGMFMSAFFTPGIVGAKAISTIQLPEGGIVCIEQVSFSFWKSETSFPVKEMFPISSGASPVFLMANECKTGEPMLPWPKSNPAGKKSIGSICSSIINWI